MKTKRILQLLSVAALLAGSAHGAESIVPVGGTYTYSQNFDGLFMPAAAGSVAATPPWADNSTIPNWWFYNAANGANAGAFAGASHAYNGNDGSVAPVLTTLNSQGAVSNPDRAFATPSTTARGEHSGIIVLQNNSAAGVDLRRIRYTGEVRRTNGTASNVESVFVWYRKAASEAAALTMTTAATSAAIFPTTVSTGPTSWYITGWTQIDAARWTYSNAAAASAIDFTTPIDADGISGIRLAPGEFLALRFSNINDGGADALMGIDDLELTFTAAALTTVVSNVVRSDSSTPQDPSDDTVSFDMVVTGSGVGPTWGISSPFSLTTSGNAYGVMKSFTGVPISEFAATAPHTLTGTIVDDVNPAVTDAFTVTAPWTTLAVTGNTFVRDAGFDPGNVLDDTFTFNLNVTSQFGSASWSSFGSAAVPVNGAYGVNIPSTPELASGFAGPVTFTDSLITDATIADVYMLPPYIIGQSTVSGAPVDVISNGELTVGPTNVSTWTNDAALRTLHMTDGDRVGGANAKTITAEVNLSAAAGPVKFSMQLVAWDNSSGFEAPDTFYAELIYNDGVSDLPPVSLITAAHDTSGNGVFADDEIVGAPPAAGTPLIITHDFGAVIPDNIQSVRLVIRGICDSAITSEQMTIQNILFEPAPPGIQVSAASNIVRVENGDGPEDDTLTFDATVTGINAGPSWTTSTPGVTPAAGAYGLTSFTIAAPLPASPFTITFADSGNPGLVGALNLTIPARAILGQRDFGGGLSDVAAPLGVTNSALWVNDPVARTITISAGTAATETVLTEVLDLTAVGDVRFTATLAANDTSAGSNYDTVDKFRAELIIDGGLITETIVNLVTPFDAGDGTSAVPFVGGVAVPNGVPDGWVNGYTGTISAVDGFAAGLDEYNAHRDRDEFNRNGQAGAENMAAELNFSHVIPAAASSVQLRITSQNINGTETSIFRDALFALYAAPLDTDGDGMDDAYEDANGLDKNNPADKLTDLDGDGQNNYSEFLAGTAANDSNSTLRITDIAPTAVPNVYNVTVATVVGRRYQLQESIDLGVTDPWANAGGVVTATAATTTVPIDITGLGPRHYLRAKVVP